MTTKNGKKKKFSLPSSFVIIFWIIVLLIILTWIPGMAKSKIGIVDIFVLPFKALKANIELIGFIFAIGAFLNIVVKTKALESALQKLVKKMSGKEILLIPVCMTLFSIGGTTYGMAEETLPFYPILIPIFLASGFDMLTAVLVIMLGAGGGTLAATLDPFKIAIAVDTSVKAGADISNSTGIIWRTISWVTITALFQSFVIWRAIRVKKDPTKSILFNRREEFANKYKMPIEDILLTKKRKATLWIFGITFLLMIFGLIAWQKFNITIFGHFNDLVVSSAPYFSTMFAALGDWYMIELSALFFISAIIIGILHWEGSDNFVNDYITGAKDLLAVALIIAFSGSVGIIMTTSGMGDIIIKALTSSLGLFNPIIFVIIIFAVFMLLSILIPSSSALAKASFPIVAPVAKAVGVLSTTVLAYSFASGLINLASPTSGYFMSILMLTNIKWGEYIKTVLPLLMATILVACIFLIIGTQLPVSIA